jgi:cytochrome c556
MQNMKSLSVLIAAVIAAVSVTFAQGQARATIQAPAPGASPAEVVKTRQQSLKALGAAFKTIRDELRGDAPDAAKIRSAATDITRAAGAIDHWFPAGTGADSGLRTDAKPEVWTDAAGFAAARDGFVREANKWAQLGNGGDVAAWKEAAASLGQSCKGCHDKYRVKKE